jgi:hypothetical protein
MKISKGLIKGCCNFSALWMYDNHTFQPVDVTTPNWREYVMSRYDIDGFGSFFVRESPNEKTIFSLYGNGKNDRETFAAALAAWNLPNDMQISANMAKPNSNLGNGSSPSPLFGFRLAKLAVWNQSQKTHKNISGIGASVFAGGVNLTAFIHRENISRYLLQHRKIEEEYEVHTSLGKMYVKPEKFDDNCARVSLAIDLNLDITDEGWIKGLDSACDAVWQRPNVKALP